MVKLFTCLEDISTINLAETGIPTLYGEPLSTEEYVFGLLLITNDLVLSENKCARSISVLNWCTPDIEPTLIITQIIDKDDPILGFFHRWVEEFAKHIDHIDVICLKKGEHTLPSNVSVYSLGKEGGESRIKYTFRVY